MAIMSETFTSFLIAEKQKERKSLLLLKQRHFILLKFRKNIQFFFVIPKNERFIFEINKQLNI